jgi:hypothetical protein
MAKAAKKSVTAKNTRNAAAATHARKAKERALDIAGLKALYIQERENPVILDILEKLKTFSNYHTKMAKDGVGVRNTGHKLQNGEAEMETVYYSNEKRVSELDKSAGLEEMLAYIERQFETPAPAK